MYKLLLVACIIWGVNVLVIKEMLEYVPIFFLASIRLWITSLILLIVCLFKKINIKITFNQTILKISFYVVILNFICTFLGLKSSSGSTVALVNGLSPFIVIILLNEYKMIWRNKMYFLAFVCSVSAVLLSISNDFINSLLNVFFLVLGLFSYSKGSILLKKHLNKENYFIYTLQYQVIGAIVLSLLSLSIESNQSIQLNQIPISLFIQFIIFSGLGFGFIQLVYSKSIYTLGNVITSSFLSLNPVVTFIASFIFFNETISLNLFISLLLLIISIIVVIKQK